MIVTCIPAAGASTRMRGRDKLLEPVHGRPILRYVADQALRAGVGLVAVFLGPDQLDRKETLKGLGVTIVEVPGARLGMSETLKACARYTLAQSDAGAMMVLLPDMPDIESTDVAALARAFDAAQGTVIRAATDSGAPGHPVIFPRSLLPKFDALAGDKGALSILHGEPVRLHKLAGIRARLDLDTPEAWAAWRDQA